VGRGKKSRSVPLMATHCEATGGGDEPSIIMGRQGRRLTPGRGLSLRETRVPDYSIGATVLFVAIALPFFILTRAQHLQRAHPQTNSKVTVLQSTQAEFQTDGPVASPSPSDGVSSQPQSLPVTAGNAVPQGRSARIKPTASSVPVATKTIKPVPTPIGTAPPDLPPVAVIAVTPNSGVAPLSVMADAGGSSDPDQTPIVQVFINFGDGSTVLANSDRTASHTYENAGTYTVTALVIDSARNSSTASSTVLVN
jgi:hypothetical protein